MLYHSIKNMIGHSNFLTTEKIYTHKDIDELRKAIDLI
jgi:site-specific recombinase XerC